MSVKIGHARASEKGNANGVKGDSTGREVEVGLFYDGNWDFVAIHPDAEVREKHAKAVEAACANNKIGYGQGDRNTLNAEAEKVKYEISKIKKSCNCDCSSLQNVAAMASGAKKVTYASNGWTTRTMKSKLKAAGYIVIEDKGYLKSCAYCVRGAIYVKAGDHTICALGNGSKSTKTLQVAGLAKTTTLVKKEVKANDRPSDKDAKLSGTYVTTSDLHMRDGAGINKKSLVVLPKGTKVKNYGYFTQVKNGAKWLWVQLTLNGVMYTGFCSEKYLKK